MQEGMEKYDLFTSSSSCKRTFRPQSVLDDFMRGSADLRPIQPSRPFGVVGRSNNLDIFTQVDGRLKISQGPSTCVS